MAESTSELIDAIEAASSRHDVASLLRVHGYEDVNQAWRHVSPVQKAALAFVRNFDAYIAQDLNDLPESDVFPGAPGGGR
jgi:hypothetical protein